MRTIRVRYDEHGRSFQGSRVLRWVLIVVAVVVLIWIVELALFNTGGTVPGSGEGDILQTP